MSMKTVKRLASRILNIGINKIWISPMDTEKVENALTTDDVRALTEEGIVTKKLKKGVSRARARKKHIQKKKGRRRGTGSIKGGVKARAKPKTLWMARVRSQRKILTGLYKEKQIGSLDRRKVYYMIKGGYFKSKKALNNYLEQNKMLKG